MREFFERGIETGGLIHGVGRSRRLYSHDLIDHFIAADLTHKQYVDWAVLFLQFRKWS